MVRAGFMLILVVCMAGCSSSSPTPRSASEAAMFAPVSMRIHPIFSGLKDWDGDSKPDGIEALLEFQDQFGDPTKACGTVVFELSSWRKYYPDPRGERLCNPWIGSLRTLADQQALWNRTSRTYQFQLAYPAVREDRSYVLTATFDTGTQLFTDRIVFEGQPKPAGSAKKRSSTEPSTEPAIGPATEPSADPSTEPAAASPLAAWPPATQGAAGVTTQP